MILTDLQIHNLRNLGSIKISLHSDSNFFFGANGSGKTSLLEAIYLLSTGHSFRTREITPLIKIGEDALTVFARTKTDETISIQKSHHQPTKVLINKAACLSNSQMAMFLPCQLFYPDIFEIIDAGPGVRRSILDWGLFHVKPNFHQLWKEYRRVLKQRNALLRHKAPSPEFTPWNNLLVELSESISALREEYFHEWQCEFKQWLLKLAAIECSISYFKGWDRKSSGKALGKILVEQLESDRIRQYTQSGAHNADILFDAFPYKAKLSLSRGQQKIILIALKLAQGSLLKKQCIYLFDDIGAELDNAHITRFLDCLEEVKGQKLLTSVGNELISQYCDRHQGKTFLLEKGVI